MLCLHSLLSHITFLSSLLSSQSNSPSLHQTSSCPNKPSLSCPSAPISDVNTCCVNHPSGHFLQTQFWDTSPSIGPSNSWTIHGLWPDLCAGGFEQFCDSDRSHSDIKGVISRALDGDKRAGELLGFMGKYWRSYDGHDEYLWSHEWNKHGTCVSTLAPDCYRSPNSTSIARHHHMDVLDYFIHTTSLFRTLDTYAILADAGIMPSQTQRYTLRELEDAVSGSRHGQTVTFRCNHRGELDEIWYHFSVMGSLANSVDHLPSHYSPLDQQAVLDNDVDSTGSVFLNTSSVYKHFLPTKPDGQISNCPRRGIKYLPKFDSSEPPSRPHPHPTKRPQQPTHGTTTAPTATSTSSPFNGRGHLEVHILPSDPSFPDSFSSPTSLERKGCLITHGQWYTSGTCATFRAKADIIDPGHQPLFSLSSSYSPCFVNPLDGNFECSPDASVQGIFSGSKEDGRVLSYRNSSVFWAEKKPGRFEKVELFVDNGDGSRNVRVEIQWVGV
jgi:ribonuclease T2